MNESLILLMVLGVGVVCGLAYFAIKGILGAWLEAMFKGRRKK